MTATVVDGSQLAEELRADVERRVGELAAEGVVPGLATVLVGEDYAARAYERRVRRLAEEMGCRYVSELLRAADRAMYQAKAAASRRKVSS